MTKFWKETWDDATMEHLKMVKEGGFNLWPLIGQYKKRSKLSEPLPDEVIQALCREYLTARSIDKSFPYFLAVLKKKSHEYFSTKIQKEHAKMKKEPVKLKISIG